MDKIRLAVVDGDHLVRQSLESILSEHAGIDVFSSDNELLQLTDFEQYECILVGGSSARNLHLELIHRGIEIPLIYLASEPSVSDAVAAIKRGAVDYLSNPITAEALAAALDAALRQKRSGVPARFLNVDVELDRVLDSVERQLICIALQRSGGVVGGCRGAAALLGVKRTGLLYKMKRLGISRTSIVDVEADGSGRVEETVPSCSISEGSNSNTAA